MARRPHVVYKHRLSFYALYLVILQSLLATRVRTVDLVEGAKLASQLLGHAFSFEASDN